jgi:hypothetical protein
MSKLRVVKEAVYGKAYVTIYAMANEEQDESNGKDS